MTDKLGKELKKGDLVLYGYRSGNTGGICFAIVTNPDKNAIFSGGYAQGFGTSGDKLIRVADEHEISACPYNDAWRKKYEQLKEGASKWL